jgi:hypothetical protein
MRRLIADVYKIMYRYTQNKVISLFTALAYITTANLLLIYGLGILAEGWLPTSYVLIAFAFPYIIGVIAAMFIFNFVIMLPLQNLSRGKDASIMYVPLIVYSLAALILFFYIKYFYMIMVEYL